MIKISAIIPLFNCSDYIQRCLDSLYRQGLEEDDFEVIVVNDGSSDNGPNIVKEFAKEHGNIILLNQPNQGVSIARNYGLSKAYGEYIHFIDADDYLMDGGWKYLFENFNIINYDIIKISSKIIKTSNLYKFNNYPLASSIFEGSSYEYLIKYGFNCAVITSLYNRQFLLNHKLSFESFAYSEDLLFNIRCFTIPDTKIIFTNAIIYGYFVRFNSASRNITKEKAFRAVKDYIGIHSILGTYHISEDINKIIRENMEGLRHNCLDKILKCNELSLSNIKQLVKLCKKNNIFPLKNRTYKDWLKNFIISYPSFIKVYQVIKN